MEGEMFQTLGRLNREHIHTIWEVAKTADLDGLTEEERWYAKVMLEHQEEYFNQFEISDLTYDHQFDPDSEENPFLHIALHVAVERQLEGKEPIEVYQFYDSMRKKTSHHDTVHLIAAMLVPLIFSALKQKKVPDLENYKSLLKKHKGRKPEKIWALMDKDLDPLF